MPATTMTMLSVTDIAESLAWYESIGFTLVEVNGDAGPETPVNWCLVDYDGAHLMLNQSGIERPEAERDSKVWILIDDVRPIYERLKPDFPMIIDLYDTFYGRTEFTVADPDGYHVTFSMRTAKGGA